MRAKRISAAAIAVALVGSAHADDSLSTKICIINAGTLLPNVPGLRIVSAQSKPLDAKAAAGQIWEHMRSSSPLDQINDRLGYIIDAKTQEDYKNAMQSGSYEEGRRIGLEALTKGLIGGAEVEMEISAANQDASFVAACGWNSDGQQMAVSMGIVK